MFLTPHTPSHPIRRGPAGRRRVHRRHRATAGIGRHGERRRSDRLGSQIQGSARPLARLGKESEANKAAADELEKLKESQMSETEKAAKRTQELEAQVAAYKAKEQQADWKAQVSAETGVPADVIEGDSLEAMQSHAKRIHELLNPKPKAPGRARR